MWNVGDRLDDVCSGPAVTQVQQHVDEARSARTRKFVVVTVADKEGAMVITAGPCPEVCTQEIAWVCVVDEVGRRSDYRNACQAMSAGARVLHPGRCVAKRACAPDGLRVCALDAHTGKEQVYANLCLAEIANAIWVRKGRCTPGRLRKLFTRSATP